jgi:hypothetical protein
MSRGEANAMNKTALMVTSVIALGAAIYCSGTARAAHFVLVDSQSEQYPPSPSGPSADVSGPPDSSVVVDANFDLTPDAAVAQSNTSVWVTNGGTPPSEPATGANEGSFQIVPDGTEQQGTCVLLLFQLNSFGNALASGKEADASTFVGGYNGVSNVPIPQIAITIVLNPQSAKPKTVFTFGPQEAEDASDSYLSFQPPFWQPQSNLTFIKSLGGTFFAHIGDTVQLSDASVSDADSSLPNGTGMASSSVSLTVQTGGSCF